MRVWWQWDDVVRTEPHTGGAIKKQVELDDSKSKKGLGELYEEEFVKQREGPDAEQEETALHKEARALWAALSMRLDGLSHFHFTPKPVVEEVHDSARLCALSLSLSPFSSSSSRVVFGRCSSFTREDKKRSFLISLSREQRHCQTNPRGWLGFGLTLPLG